MGGNPDLAECPHSSFIWPWSASKSSLILYFGSCLINMLMPLQTNMSPSWQPSYSLFPLWLPFAASYWMRTFLVTPHFLTHLTSSPANDWEKKVWITYVNKILILQRRKWFCFLSCLINWGIKIFSFHALCMPFIGVGSWSSWSPDCQILGCVSMCIKY